MQLNIVDLDIMKFSCSYCKVQRGRCRNAKGDAVYKGHRQRIEGFQNLLKEIYKMPTISLEAISIINCDECGQMKGYPCISKYAGDDYATRFIMHVHEARLNQLPENKRRKESEICLVQDWLKNEL